MPVLPVLRNLFIKSKDAPPRGGPLPGGLPVELWVHILSFVTDRQDILSLCYVARGLYPVAKVSFYTSLNIQVGKKISRTTGRFISRYQLRKLHKTIQAPLLADIITEVRVGLTWCQDRFTSAPGPKNRQLDALRCSCSQSNTNIGQILLSLPQLHVLYFKCIRCVPSPEGHRYLEQLPTRSLQQLYFQCQCTTPDMEVPFSVSQSQCMATVTTLWWMRLFYPGEFPEPLWKQFTEQRDYFPQVQKIVCDDLRPMRSVLRRGNITHLDCDDYDENLTKFLPTGTASLHYLRTTRLQSVVLAIQQNQSPYRNIQHLGIFILDMSAPDQIPTSMKGLACLPKLRSVEMWLQYDFSNRYDMSHPYHNADRDTLVSDIALHLAGLRRAYIKKVWFQGKAGPHYQHRIWEFTNSWYIRELCDQPGWETDTRSRWSMNEFY